MNGKQIIYGDEARQKLKAGIDKVADAVKTTLGPAGRCAVLRSAWGGSPTSTKDGVTVADNIILADPLEDTGAQLCKQVSKKTNDAAGDGTTTATVLAQAMVAEAYRALGAGGNANAIRRGMDKATQRAIQSVDALKVDVKMEDIDKLRFVATVSGNDPEVGRLVSEAYEKVGKDGVVMMDQSGDAFTTIETTEGMRFDRGYIAPHFMTDPSKMVAEYEDAHILILARSITNAHEIMPFLVNYNTAYPEGKLVILADIPDPSDALATLVVNKLKGALRVVAIRPPGFGERQKGLLTDLAMFTGGTFLDESMGVELKNVTMEQLGKVKKITVSEGEFTILGGYGEKKSLDAHIEGLKKKAEETKSKFDKEKYVERVAKLSSGVAIIKIGASTETELKEKRYRFEDAINATKGAIEHGIVPGSGFTLVSAQKDVFELAKDLEDPDEKAGALAVARALQVPAQTIASNGGYDGGVILNAMREGQGFDARTGQYVPDLVTAGIIDPAKVTKSALQNAASIAGTFVTTETLIVDLPEEKN